MNQSNSKLIEGRDISLRVADTLAIEVLDSNGKIMFASSGADVPSVRIAEGQTQPLHTATQIECKPYDDAGYTGRRITLGGFAEHDAQFELVLAINQQDVLLVSIEQTGGADVRGIEHLYRLEKPVSDGGYMILPHGSGYLIDSDCPDALPGDCGSEDMVGGRWAMPLFGLAHDALGMCVIIEDWWDCKVTAVHAPGELSALDINWEPSLGKLAYKRQMKLHFAKGMDHTAMAKIYREQYARPQGLVRTLAQKAKVTPAIEPYIKRILVRWPAWDPDLRDQVIEDLKRFREMGFEVTLFFPKWPSKGYSKELSTGNTSDGGWMAWMHTTPVPGGWAELKKFFDEVHDLGILNQGFMNPGCHVPGQPQFSEARLARDEKGNLPHLIPDFGYNYFCSHDDIERVTGSVKHAADQGLPFDAIYFDGYTAHCGVREDFSPEHPLTRKENFEAESQAMANTRDLGTMPGGELARFWCLDNCDFFFYSDWSSDRLTNVPTQQSTDSVGEFIPLFQLAFNDCCMASFSGGGHEAYVKGVDWWHDRTPRLYELLSCSAPCFNWLPQNSVPVADWDSEKAQAKFAWLRRRSAWFQAIAMSEMTSHQFLDDARKLQRIEFANGVWAEFDMAKNLCCVHGVEGFSGDWEEPSDYLGLYRPPPGSDLANKE
jgi:hypothetical protein